MEKRKVTVQRNAIENFLMFLKEFVKAHRKTVLIGFVTFIIAVVLFLAGAVFYDIKSTAELREYETLMNAYESGPRDAAAFTDTVSKLVKITDKSWFGYVHKNGYYIAAGMYFEHKMYDDAKIYYLKFADKSSSPVLVPLALFQAAICAENGEKYDEALSIYKKIEKSYKDTGFNDRMMYDMGRMYQKKGDRITAKEYFNKVISQYPNSWFAVQSKVRVFILGI
jgi:tetratricopeptide (TPR) repeat protein